MTCILLLGTVYKLFIGN
uniref:Uncharacterized protein n=1 Tax=Rhizophora mucronata TaxID=61149 RepID=A0A2P2R539_RHIMU